MSNIDTLLAAALASASDARNAADRAARDASAADRAQWRAAFVAGRAHAVAFDKRAIDASARWREAQKAASLAERKAARAKFHARLADAYAARLKAHLAEWGEPCEEFDPECCACQAWHVFNAAHNA